jgi:hypothetical protein
MAECPKCGRTVRTVKGEPVPVDGGPGHHWNGLAYTCPSCSAILSVSIDPISLKSDMVAEILDEVRRLLGRQ